MTVFAKPNILHKAENSSKSPLVDEAVCPEAKIAVPPSENAGEPPVHFSGTSSLIFSFVNALLVVTLVITTGVVVFHQYKTDRTRYRGICSIPISAKSGEPIEQSVRVQPLSWSSKPDLQVISTATDESATEDFVNMLHEELDIDGMVEKISVLNNGETVNFIHDFATNTTSIIDSDRCFIMELNRELVMTPDVFVVSIQRGSDFDVSNVRSELSALLPAVRELPALPAPCRALPTYRLRRDDRLVRKRSAAAPHRDYLHFSGKHIQQIEIGNLEEVLEYEKRNKA